MTSVGRVTVLAAVVGGSVLAGYAVPAGSWLLAAGAATAIALTVVAVIAQAKAPIMGLTVLLLTGVLTPLEVARGEAVFNVCVPLAAFLCGAFFLRLTIARNRVALDHSRVVIATLVFVAVAIVSFVVGQYPWFPTARAPMTAQVGGLGLFMLSGGLFLVVGHQVASLRQLQRVTWVFVGSGALAVVTSLVSTFDVTLGPVAITNAGSIGSAFWTWLVAISLAQALFNRDLSVPVRVALGGVAAFALARGLLAAFSWASGWLPPLVAIGVVLLFRFPRCTVAFGFLVMAPALLYGGPALNAWMAEESYSTMTRLEALRVMWQVVRHNPWLGFGPANYYHYTVLFPILGWWVRFNSHNNYVDLIGQTGLIGLLAFSWFVVEVLRLALRLRPRMQRGFERAYLVGAVAGLAGSLVSGLLADWIVPFVYNIGIGGFRSSLLFWFFLGGVLALKRIDLAAPRTAAAGPAGATRQLSSDVSGLFRFTEAPASAVRVR